MEWKPLEWYMANGCELCSPSLATFMVVYGLTNGSPCAECNCKDTCEAWKLINHPTAKLQP